MIIQIPHMEEAINGCSKTKIYGLLAEFETPTQIVDAANQAREAGYTAMEAYSPFPVMDLHEAVGFKRTILPTLAFLEA